MLAQQEAVVEKDCVTTEPKERLHSGLVKKEEAIPSPWH